MYRTWTVAASGEKTCETKKKKKKKENAETETQETANPNTHLIYELGSSEIWYNFNKSIVELHLLLMTYMLATFKITKD